MDLLAERFDVALRVGPLEDGRLTRRTLVVMRQCVCAAPAYLQARGTPQGPAELAGHVHLTYLRGGRQEMWDPITRRRVTARAPYAADSNAALRQLALDGLGVALLPELTVAEDLRRGALMPLVPELTAEEGQPISLVFPPGQTARRAGAGLRGLLRRGGSPLTAPLTPLSR